MPFLGFLDTMPSAEVFVAIQVVGDAGRARPRWCAALTRRRPQAAFAVAWVCYLVLAGLRGSRGKVLHNDLLLLWVSAPFLLAPAVRSADDLRDRVARRRWGWPIRVAIVITALIYFFAGYHKLRRSGLEWAYSDNMRYVALWGPSIGAPGWPGLAQWVGDNVWVARASGVFILGSRADVPRGDLRAVDRGCCTPRPRCSCTPRPGCCWASTTGRGPSPCRWCWSTGRTSSPGRGAASARPGRRSRRRRRSRPARPTARWPARRVRGRRGMIVVAAFVAGVLAALALWRLTAAAFAVPVFERENYRERRLPTAVGVLVALVVLAVDAVVAVAVAAGAEPDADAVTGLRLVTVAAVGFGLLGLLDDLGGAGESGGFRGHLRSLATGRLTTGAVKLFGGAAVAVVVVATIEPDSARPAAGRRGARRAGRQPREPVRPGAGPHDQGDAAWRWWCSCSGSAPSPSWPGWRSRSARGRGCCRPTSVERLMLGDAGANVLGAALGLGRGPGLLAHHPHRGARGRGAAQPGERAGLVQPGDRRGAPAAGRRPLGPRALICRAVARPSLGGRRSEQGVDHRPQRVGRDVLGREGAGAEAVVDRGHAEQQVLAADVVVPEVDGGGQGPLERGLGVAAEADVAPDGGVGRRVRLVDERHERGPVDAELVEGDHAEVAVALLVQPQQHVLGADDVVAAPACHGLRGDDGGTGPGREALELAGPQALDEPSEQAAAVALLRGLARHAECLTDLVPRAALVARVLARSGRAARRRGFPSGP